MPSLFESPPPTAATDGGTVGEKPSRVARSERRVWVEWGQVLALLLICVTFFLWKPITSDGYYAPGDLSQNDPVLRTTPDDALVSNPVLGDVSTDILPWQLRNASEIRDGKLPLWNPYNGSGAPLLANGQAAPFSPFNVAFYVLSIRLALIASAAMILMVSGLLAYGLARHLGIGQVGGLTAAVGFAFAGVNVVWLRWPITATAALMPGIIWMACVVVGASGRRRRLLGAAGLSAVVAASMFSGHPETTFYSLVGSAIFVVCRLVTKHLNLREAVGRLSILAGGIALGGGLAAVQLLPTFEYLAHRAPSGDRQAFADTKYVGLLAFPFLGGSPFGAQRSRVLPIVIPYVKGVELYMGAGFILLAMIGYLALARQRRPLAVGLAVVGVTWLLFIFDVAGFGRLVTRLPGLGLAMALRSIPLWALAISLFAGAGIDAARRAWTAAARRRILVEISGCTLLLLILGIALQAQLGRALPHAASAVESASAAASGRHHLFFVITWFVVALAALVAPLLLARNGRRATVKRAIEVASVALLLFALFVSSGYAWRDWNPTVTPSLFYARSTAFDQIQAVVGDEQVLRLDRSAIDPDMNLQYRVRSPENYDALGVSTYDALYRRLLHPPTVVFDGTTIGILAGPVQPSGLGNLRAIGIRYVTTGTTYPFASGTLSGRTASPKGGRTSESTFSPQAGGASTVSELVARSPAMTRGSTCRVVLHRGASRLAPPWQGPCPGPGVALALPRAVAVGGGFSVTLTITASAGTPAISSPIAVTAVDTRVPGLELAADVQGFAVYRVPDAPAHVFSPASTVASDPSGRLLDGPGMQPRRLSLVDAADGGSDGAEPGVVRVTKDDAGDIRFDVTRTTPGWAIVMETFYPGWKATVSGHATQVRRANGAFMAVHVPAGSTTVRLSYAPSSVQVGLIISLVSAAGLALGLGLGLGAACQRRLQRRREAVHANA